MSEHPIGAYTGALDAEALAPHVAMTCGCGVDIYAPTHGALLDRWLAHHQMVAQASSMMRHPALAGDL